MDKFYKNLKIALLVLLLTAVIGIIFPSYAQNAGQDINLHAGFNFVCFSVSPQTTPLELMQKYSSLIEDIYLFNAAAGSFLSLSDGSLSSISSGKGYIIKSKASGIINVPGTEASGSDLPLKPGFNLIGVTGQTSAITFSQVMKNYHFIKGIYKWNPAAGSFISVITDGTGSTHLVDGADPRFSPATSYFINISDGCFLRFTENGISFYAASSTAAEKIKIELSPKVTLEMAKIYSAGKSFKMGSPENEQGRASFEGPERQVSFTRNFYMGIYEITQAQWLTIYGKWPETAPTAAYGAGDYYPAYNVSWDDINGAGGFLEKINALKPSGYSGFRLPTEAEWEFAARGGSQSRYFWGDDTDNIEIQNYSWYYTNSGLKTNPAGSKRPNAFGLYDTSGNLMEWCSDYWYGSYDSLSVIDPAGPSSGYARVRRGGAWGNEASFCRSAARGGGPQNTRSIRYGFRIAITAD